MPARLQGGSEGKMTDEKQQTQSESPLHYFTRKAKDLGVEHLVRNRWGINYTVPSGTVPWTSEAREAIYRITRNGLELGEVRLSQEHLIATLRRDSQELGFGYEVIYYSARSERDVIILSGEGTESRIHLSELPSYRPRPPGNVQLRDPTRFFYFGINGLTNIDPLRHRNDVEFRVKDLVIANASVREGIKVPNSLFQTEQDYRPAVDWILQEYASGLAGATIKSK